MILEHRHSRAEIARALDLTPEQLGHRLAIMVRQGFLVIERPCGHGDGAGSCRHCRMRCGGNEVTGYGLTEKGRRLAGVPTHDPSPASE